jgi:predicted amidophosphoribosyltransferase
MVRHCPACGAALESFAVRCQCGAALPEAKDLRSDPDHPACGVCGTAMPLMSESCPTCGVRGYPALRARRSNRSLGAPEDSA